MFSENETYLYRTLTKIEQKSMEEAIRWLSKQHIKATQIALLKQTNLDRESKIIEIETPVRSWFIQRRIGYQGTAFDEYLTSTFPGLRSKDWVFPSSVWKGEKPSFGFHVKIQGVENFLKNDRKKVLINLKKYSMIELSTKRLHIQKPTTGRKAISL